MVVAHLGWVDFRFEVLPAGGLLATAASYLLLKRDGGTFQI